jgi:uncharacterized protein YciU (UPF0263 family)
MFLAELYIQGDMINTKITPDNGLSHTSDNDMIDECKKQAINFILRNEKFFNNALSLPNIFAINLSVNEQLQCTSITFKGHSSRNIPSTASFTESVLGVLNSQDNQNEQNIVRVLEYLSTLKEDSGTPVVRKFAYISTSFNYFMLSEISSLPTWLKNGNIPEKVSNLLYFAKDIQNYDGMLDSSEEYFALFAEWAERFGFDIKRAPYMSAVFALISSAKDKISDDLTSHISDKSSESLAKLHFFLYAYVAAYQGNSQFFYDLENYIKQAPVPSALSVSGGLDTLIALGLAPNRPKNAGKNELIDVFCETRIPKI